jgi:hypothetical protein
MTRRVTTKCVVFRRPFVVDPVDGEELSPGLYTIETEEESLDTVSFLAYRRVSTVIRVCTGGNTRLIAVDPDVLAAALRGDTGATE